MGIPDHLTCLLRNLYAGQEATVRTVHAKTDWFQIRKGVRQAVYCHPAYLTYMQSTSWEMLDWMKCSWNQDRWGKYQYLRCADNTTLVAESEEERGEWKTWLKTQHSKDEDHGIWSHHFIAYSWGNNENSDRLHFLPLEWYHLHIWHCWYFSQKSWF